MKFERVGAWSVFQALFLYVQYIDIGGELCSNL